MIVYVVMASADYEDSYLCAAFSTPEQAVEYCVVEARKSDNRMDSYGVEAVTIDGGPGCDVRVWGKLYYNEIQRGEKQIDPNEPLAKLQKWAAEQE